MLLNKFYYSLFLVFLFAIKAQGQVPSLNYAVAIKKFELFYNAGEADSLYNMYSIQMKAALPQDKNKQFVEGLRLQLGKLVNTSLVKQSADYALFLATFEKEKTYIIFPLNQKNELSGLRFQPYQEPKKAEDYHSNFSVLSQSGDSLFGTLSAPNQAVKGEKKTVLIIAGSGPTDRDGNNSLGVSAQSYKMLADSLNQHGFYVVRYDKRGVGQSIQKQGSEEDLRFDDMVSDALAFLRKIKAEHSKVYLIGHSEGSLVSILAAELESVDGLVSLAGMGQSAGAIILEQLSAQVDSKTLAEATKIVNSLNAGEKAAINNEDLKPLFRSSVQPFLISFFAYDPAKELAKVKSPTLIIQGSTDLQVKEKEAIILQKGKPDAELHIIKGMNHVLKYASDKREENIATYKQPELPIPSELVKVLTNFINQH